MVKLSAGSDELTVITYSPIEAFSNTVASVYVFKKNGFELGSGIMLNLIV